MMTDEVVFANVPSTWKVTLRNCREVACKASNLHHFKLIIVLNFSRDKNGFAIACSFVSQMRKKTFDAHVTRSKCVI